MTLLSNYIADPCIAVQILCSSAGTFALVQERDAETDLWCFYMVFTGRQTSCRQLRELAFYKELGKSWGQREDDRRQGNEEESVLPLALGKYCQSPTSKVLFYFLLARKEVTSVHYFWLFRRHERTGVISYICALRTQTPQLMAASSFYADSFLVFWGNECP